MDYYGSIGGFTMNTIIKRWQHWRQIVSLFLKAGIFLVLVLGLVGCHLFPKEEEEDVSTLIQPKVEEVVTDTVTVGPISDEIQGTVRVGSSQEKILYFLTSGRVHEVMTKIGDTVKKGQPLVSLETGDLDFAVKQANLSLEQEQLRYQLQGYDNNVIPKQIAAIDVEKAHLEYERLSEQLDHTILRAPINGKILDLDTATGRSIDAFTKLGTIAGMKGLELIAEVNLTDMLRVKPGMAARVEMDEGQWETGQIIAIDKPESTLSNNDSYYIHTRIDNPRIPLKMDSYHTVCFVVRSVKQALLIPNDAVREDVNSRKYLRVIEGKQRRDVYIKTGIVSDTMTQITDGATAGMIVVGK